MNRLHPIALALTLTATPAIGLAYSAERADAEEQCQAAAEMDHVMAYELDAYLAECVAAMLEPPEGDQEPASIDDR